MATRTKVESSPSLLEEGLEGVSVNVEGLEAGPIVASVPPKKRDSILKTIGAEAKDAFGMGKVNVPATAS